MNKAFTLIELIIVIAIIALMAVVAMPMFDKFAAQAELNDAADEIKMSLETAYRDAISPSAGNNAARISITGGSNPGMLSEKGYCADAIDDVCSAFTVDTADIEEVSFKSGKFAINDLSIISAGSKVGSTPLSVTFKSPLDESDILVKDGSGVLVSADRIELLLFRENTTYQKQITINRYPFSVTIKNDE